MLKWLIGYIRFEELDICTALEGISLYIATLIAELDISNSHVAILELVMAKSKSEQWAT